MNKNTSVSLKYNELSLLITIYFVVTNEHLCTGILIGAVGGV